MEWWGTVKEPNKRLENEKEAMRDAFPEGQWARIDTAKTSHWPKPDFWIFVEACRLAMTAEGRLRWRIRFRFWEDDKNWQFPNSPSEYAFTLNYPGDENYPSYPPEVLIKTWLGDGIGHRWKIGDVSSKPCLFDPYAGREYGWDPGQDTAMVVACWVFEWLLAYRVLREIGSWPPEVDAD